MIVFTPDTCVFPDEEITYSDQNQEPFTVGDDDVLTPGGGSLNPGDTIQIVYNPDVMESVFTVMHLKLTVTGVTKVTVTYKDIADGTIGSPLEASRLT